MFMASKSRKLAAMLIGYSCAALCCLLLSIRASGAGSDRSYSLAYGTLQNRPDKLPLERRSAGGVGDKGQRRPARTDGACLLPPRYQCDGRACRLFARRRCDERRMERGAVQANQRDALVQP